MDDLTKTLIDIAAPVQRPVVLRASAIKVGYLQSMLHMRHYYQSGKEDTAGMRAGRLAHMAILEPHKAPVIWTGAVRRGKEWDKFQINHDGEEISNQEEWDNARKCADAVYRNADAVRLLDGTLKEVEARFDHPTLGLCSARFDAITEDRIIDIKGTGRVDSHSFARTCASLAYQVQFGWYSMIAAEVYGYRFPDCYAIVHEQDEPHDVAVYKMSKLDVQCGMRDALKVGALYRECELSRVWPGIESGIKELTMPEWAYKQQDAAPAEAGDWTEL